MSNQKKNAFRELFDEIEIPEMLAPENIALMLKEKSKSSTYKMTADINKDGVIPILADNTQPQISVSSNRENTEKQKEQKKNGKDTPVGIKSSPNSVLFRITASVAACIVLFAGISFYVGKNGESTQLPSVTVPASNGTEPASATDNYSEVYNAFRTYYTNGTANKITESVEPAADNVASSSNYVDSDVSQRWKYPEPEASGSVQPRTAVVNNGDLYSVNNSSLYGVTTIDGEMAELFNSKYIISDNSGFYYTKLFLYGDKLIAVANEWEFVEISSSADSSSADSAENSEITPVVTALSEGFTPDDDFSENTDDLLVTPADDNADVSEVNDDVLAYEEKLDVDTYWKEGAIIDVFDISDISNIVMIERYIQSGGYVDAYMADGVVYLTTYYYNADPTPIASAEDLERYVPSFIVNGEKQYISADDIVVSSSPASLTYTVVSGISISASGAELVSAKAFLGYDNVVYGDNSVMLLSDSRSYQGLPTSIAYLSLNSGKVSYVGENAIQGSAVASAKSNDSYCVATVEVIDTANYLNRLYVYDKLGTQVQSFNLTEIFALEKNDRISRVFFDGAVCYGILVGEYEPRIVLDIEKASSAVDNTSLYSFMYKKFGSDCYVSLAQSEDSLSILLEVTRIENGEHVVTTAEIESKNPDGAITSTALYDSTALLADYENNIIAVPTSYFDGVDNVFAYHVFTLTSDMELIEIGTLEFHETADEFNFKMALIDDNMLYAVSDAQIVVSTIDTISPISIFRIDDFEEYVGNHE